MSAGSTVCDAFDYDRAFKRNLGFVTAVEQQRLRDTRIAIAGLGGTGGVQAEALARLGIGRFALADPDHFELGNFNRQIGASTATLGRMKVEVMRERILTINPDADVEIFPGGIDEGNIEKFLSGTTIIVDSLDMYAFAARLLLYRTARRNRLWVVNVAPAATGATVLNFDPDGMSFEDYFGLHEGMSDRDRFIALFQGTNPSLSIKLRAVRYIRKAGFFDRAEQAPGARSGLPCYSPTFFFVAGFTAVEVINILFERRPRRAVPRVFVLEGMLQVATKKYLPFGLRSPWQRLKRSLLRKFAFPQRKDQGGT
jgi:molybdopterin-synthase adenylyltransferase